MATLTANDNALGQEANNGYGEVRFFATYAPSGQSTSSFALANLGGNHTRYIFTSGANDFTFSSLQPVDGTITAVEVQRWNSGTSQWVTTELWSGLNVSVVTFNDAMNDTNEPRGLATFNLAFWGGNDTMLGGEVDDRLFGYAGADTLEGRTGDDRLNGGLGIDTMRGEEGNDTYYVNNSADVVVETLNNGIDSVQATSSYTLSANVENLTISGPGNFNATGNALANVLAGNSNANVLKGMGGADTLVGGLGKDTLTGGAGADKFLLTASGTAHADKITDFTHNSDTIQLDNAIFGALGADALNLAATKFWKGTAAHDGNDRVIYDPANGKLYYDANGNKAGGSVLLATLDDGLNLTASDFQVV